jgi:hypothetical protein
VGLIGIYLILVLLGASQSSIGSPMLRQDPAHPLGHQIGSPQSIRSDEFLTDTPIALGEIAAAEAYTSNPLTQPPNFLHQIPSGPTSSITMFEGTLARIGGVIPDEMAFAARWWLPTLLLVIFTPLWFGEVTGRRRFGYLCAAMIFFAPSNAWWSMRPVSILGFVFAGSYLIFPASRGVAERRWLRTVLLGLAAGVLLARYPAQYQPFALVIGVPVIVATLATFLTRPLPRRTKAIALGVVGACAAVFVAGLMAENWEAIQASFATVYPGSRRSSGAPSAVSDLFGAPALGAMTSTAQIVGSNASEIASAFTVSVVWAAILLVAGRAGWLKGNRAAIIVVGAFTAFWLSWCMLSWGRVGEHVPIANLVPPHRASAMVGALGSLLICLMLSQWSRPSSWNTPLIAGGVVAALTGWGGSSLAAQFFPGLRPLTVWSIALVAGVCVALVTRFPDRLFPIGLTVVAVAAVSFRANPVIFGLGDLRGSTTAKAMLAEGATSRDADRVWASDSLPFDSLMLATGVPALSGRQQMGPRTDEWIQIDPGRTHENAWNRGGMYIRFVWNTATSPTFSNPTDDQLFMGISPCELHRRIPSLQRIATTTPLQLDCLRLRRQLLWAGQRHWIYDIADGVR